MQAQARDDGSADPPAPTNLAQLITRQAVARPGAVALVQPASRAGAGGGRRERTWSELDAEVDALAAGLVAYGLVAGQRVGLLGANSLEFVVAYLAVLRLGGVAVPLNPQLTGVELEALVADSGLRLLFRDPTAPTAGVRSALLTPAGLDEWSRRSAGDISSPRDPEALAVLLYTAGTSGRPKAAMLTHRALLAHLAHVDALGLVDPDTVVLAVLPLFHVFGLNAVLGGWAFAGARLVLLDDAGRLPEVVQDEGVTNLPVAPTLLHQLVADERSREALVSVQTVISGAAPLPPQLSTRFSELTGLRVDQGYGLTEAAPGVTLTWGADDAVRARPGHVGRALPGVELRIGDGSEPGEPGEIWLRGANVFSGYWPDGAGGPGVDGWLATGDVGYLDSGELFLVDRSRELVLVHGFNVFPAEVEEAIAELDGVSAVAVIGRPDERSGEQVVAFVVAPGLSEADVVEHCRTRLAKFKRPTLIRMVAELPRGATGKVRKGELRSRLVSADGPQDDQPR